MDLSAFGSNVLGALTVAGMAGIAYCVKNKMKHSECDLNMPCLKIRSHEDDETRNTIRQEVLDELRKEGLLLSSPHLSNDREISRRANQAHRSPSSRWIALSFSPCLRSLWAHQGSEPGRVTGYDGRARIYVPDTVFAQRLPSCFQNTR